MPDIQPGGLDPTRVSQTPNTIGRIVPASGAGTPLVPQSTDRLGIVPPAPDELAPPPVLTTQLTPPLPLPKLLARLSAISDLGENLSPDAAAILFDAVDKPKPRRA